LNNSAAFSLLLVPWDSGKNCLIAQRGFEGLSWSTAKKVRPKPPRPRGLMAR